MILGYICISWNRFTQLFNHHYLNIFTDEKLNFWTNIWYWLCNHFYLCSNTHRAPCTNNSMKSVFETPFTIDKHLSLNISYVSIKIMFDEPTLVCLLLTLQHLCALFIFEQFSAQFNCWYFTACFSNFVYNGNLIIILQYTLVFS